ncbi:hypothetical protein U2G91_26035 (plasmid) [Rhodococcoides fascians]|uniref:hypothetical protein n=1 Tax=Rhodococcoides fascians TaxID=1828 RepID=UPI002ACE3BCD|nr:hypothetical protein [Rhodococcus fascians]WQH31268.1 hypothetical protein U2G91_26035 [Rhodococcus fascians]
MVNAGGGELIAVSVAEEALSAADVASLAIVGSAQPAMSRPDRATPVIHGHR